MKKKVLIIGAGILGLVTAIMLLVYIFAGRVELNGNVPTFEAGVDEVNLGLSDFVDNPGDKLELIVSEDDADEIGVHEVSIRKPILWGILYGTTKAQYIVQDTIAPEFVSFREELIIGVTGKVIDLRRYVAAIDAGGVPVITFTSDREIDTTKEGAYVVKVTARDPSGNKTEKDMTVKLLKDTDTEEELSKPITDKDVEDAGVKGYQSGNSEKEDEENLENLKKLEEKIKEEYGWDDFDASSFYRPSEETRLTLDEAALVFMYASKDGVFNPDDIPGEFRLKDGSQDNG